MDVKYSKLYSPFVRDKLRLSITSSCNTNCFYCHNEGQGHFCDKDFLSLKFVESLANYLKENNFRIHKLNVTGGEPLLHPNLNDIILTLKPYADRIRLNTNAILLDDDKTDELLELGVTSFKIGLDSVWDDKNEGIKARKLENMKHTIDYIDNRSSVVFNMVVSKYNYNHIDDMIEFSRECGAQRLKINELVNYNFRNSDDFDNSHSDAFWTAFNKYYRICRHFKYHKELGMYDMVLQNGFHLRWCASFCNARSCGNMYTVINSRGECVVCPISNEAIKIDFSKNSEVITSLFLDLPNKSCGTSGRKYIRDINGNLIKNNVNSFGWKWEKETNNYWMTPDECVYWLADRWKNTKNDCVLDLGAGLGRHTVFFAQHGYSVKSLDISSYAINHIKTIQKGMPIVATIGNMEELPYGNESIGNVLAFNSISHTNQFGIREIFREVYRVLKPEGEFYFTICSKEAESYSINNIRIDNNTLIKLKDGPEFGVPHFYTDYSQLKILLSNFTIVKIEHIKSLYYDNGDHCSCHYSVLVKKEK